jgi:uncharacterized protein
MHFYESSIITTKDGLHCQVYGNEHPIDKILVKPKYIPTDKIACNKLNYRFISGRKMNRLNLWTDKSALKEYLENFKEAYTNYVFISEFHDKETLFFGVPINHIERIYFPRTGLSELMSMPEDSLDEHLKTVYDFAQFLLKSGLRVKDLGLTYSTLMGHYVSKISDINIVVYGKDNFWKLMQYLEEAKHPLLRWKEKEQWMEFYKKRNRFEIFDPDQFLRDMQRKKSEGYFNDTLFVIFAVEKEEETWFKWGEESYESLGLIEVQGIVTNNFSSIVRPGVYEIKDSKIIAPEEININTEVAVKKIVFYSRDYCMLAYPGEKINACGLLEKVTPKSGEPYYRVVVGYFDAYINERREKEFIRTIV